MKVRILKASSPFFWYSNKIGEVLNVKVIPNDKQSFITDWYTKIEDTGNIISIAYLVLINDVEIIME